MESREPSLAITTSSAFMVIWLYDTKTSFVLSTTIDFLAILEKYEFCIVTDFARETVKPLIGTCANVELIIFASFTLMAWISNVSKTIMKC